LHHRSLTESQLDSSTFLHEEGTVIEHTSSEQSLNDKVKPFKSSTHLYYSLLEEEQGAGVFSRTLEDSALGVMSNFKGKHNIEQLFCR
jgi:hypothetical protein